MTTPSYCLFDTAIGACAIAWGERGLKGVQLPEADAAKNLMSVTNALPPMAKRTGQNPLVCCTAMDTVYEIATCYPTAAASAPVFVPELRFVSCKPCALQEVSRPQLFLELGGFLRGAPTEKTQCAVSRKHEHERGGKRRV